MYNSIPYEQKESILKLCFLNTFADPYDADFNIKNICDRDCFGNFNYFDSWQQLYQYVSHYDTEELCIINNDKSIDKLVKMDASISISTSITDLLSFAISVIKIYNE